MKKPLDDFVRECSERNKGNWCKEVYSVTNSQGFVPSTDYFSKEVFSKDLNNYKIVREGMIAYNPSRINVGSVATQREKGVVIVSPLYVVFSVDEQNLYPEYLCYFLRSEIGLAEIAKKTSGSVRDSLKFSALQKINIRVRDLREQKFIVSILQKTERIIEKYRLLLAKLDDLVKSQFIEMFGDLRENPKGWCFIPLGKVCDVRDGTHDSPKYCSEGYPLLTSKNFTDGEVDFTGANFISEKDFVAINQRSRVDVGDIVMPMIGTIGHPVIINTSRPFAIKNVALIKFAKSEFLNVFIKEILKSDYFLAIISSKNRGNTQKFIALGDIRAIEIPQVPHQMQEQFARFVEQTDKSKFRR